MISHACFGFRTSCMTLICTTHIHPRDTLAAFSGGDCLSKHCLLYMADASPMLTNCLSNFHQVSPLRPERCSLHVAGNHRLGKSASAKDPLAAGPKRCGARMFIARLFMSSQDEPKPWAILIRDANKIHRILTGWEPPN